MVMIEDTVLLDDGTVVFNHENDKRKNIIEVGEDIKVGEVVLKIGTPISAHEIGALISLGITEVLVTKKPSIIIISTGDELIGLNDKQTYGKVRDINTPMLSIEAKKMGFEVLDTYVIQDDFELIQHCLRNSNLRADLVCISGGSSVGEKDITAEIMQSLGSPGIIVHGMAIKPGKPTILASCNQKPMFGLPGHPVSALVVFRILATQLLKTWNYKVSDTKEVQAILMDDVVGEKNRDTYQMVTITTDEKGSYVRPTSGKSGLITYLTSSNGFIILAKENHKVKKNSVVQAFYFDYDHK
jgi:molybdopterin molybdotransferase